MSRVLFIIPYFGNLPNTFRFWLEGCRYNEKFNWLLITDDKTEYGYPSNIKVIYSTFNDLKERIERKLNICTALNRPYKLCDFRPLYGFIFDQELQGYTHWGYCDLDLLFGDLSEFLSDDLLERYDKIHALGHMSVIKCNSDLIDIYKKCDYKSILQKEELHAFDEIARIPNFNELIVENGYELFRKISYADVGSLHFNFHLYDYCGKRKTRQKKHYPVIFEFNNGKAFQHELINGKLVKKEVAYVHLKKRKVLIDDAEVGKPYALVPNRLVTVHKIDQSFILKNSRDDYIYYLDCLFQKCKRKIM